MKKVLALILLLVCALLTGCSSVSQSEAEGIARSFIDQNVKFFAQEQGQPKTLSQVDEPTVMSHQEGDVWVVITHVSSEVNGTTKQGDLIVKVDKRGKVIEFNGKKLE